MDLVLRNIDPTAIAKIDETAKKKKISRNELLKVYIESYAVAPELKELEEKYQNLITKIVSVIERNNGLCEQVIEVLEKAVNTGDYQGVMTL